MYQISHALSPDASFVQSSKNTNCLVIFRSSQPHKTEHIFGNVA